MVDTSDSKSDELTLVRVRSPPTVPDTNTLLYVQEIFCVYIVWGANWRVVIRLCLILLHYFLTYFVPIFHSVEIIFCENISVPRLSHHQYSFNFSGCICTDISYVFYQTSSSYIYTDISFCLIVIVLTCKYYI